MILFSPAAVFLLVYFTFSSVTLHLILKHLQLLSSFPAALQAAAVCTKYEQEARYTVQAQSRWSTFQKFKKVQLKTKNTIFKRRLVAIV